MSSGRLIQPGVANVGVNYAPGPLAQPCVVTGQGAGGVQLLVIGGCPTVALLAATLYGGDPVQAVDAAEAILTECERRAKEREQVASG